MKPMMPMLGWYFRVSPRMITCKEFNDFIYDYVEENLTPEQNILFKRHMKVCPMCRNFLRTYLATYNAKDELLPYSDLDVPASVPQDLIDAILDVRSQED